MDTLKISLKSSLNNNNILEYDQLEMPIGSIDVTTCIRVSWRTSKERTVRAINGELKLDDSQESHSSVVCSGNNHKFTLVNFTEGAKIIIPDKYEITALSENQNFSCYFEALKYCGYINSFVHEGGSYTGRVYGSVEDFLYKKEDKIENIRLNDFNTNLISGNTFENFSRCTNLFTFTTRNTIGNIMSFCTLSKLTQLNCVGGTHITCELKDFLDEMAIHRDSGTISIYPNEGFTLNGEPYQTQKSFTFDNEGWHEN